MKKTDRQITGQNPEGADHLKALQDHLRKRGASKNGTSPDLLASLDETGQKLFSQVILRRARISDESVLSRFTIPETILNALCCLRRHGQGRKVEAFLSRIVSESMVLPEDQLRNWLYHFLEADPGLFLDFCRPVAPKAEKLKFLLEKASKELTRKLPERALLGTTILQTIFRRIAGDFTARSPLLVGPPGTGKSQLLRMASSALTAAGLPTTSCFISLAGGNGVNQGEQLEMRLLGTDCRYSNAKSGEIYKAALDGNNRLVLVLLDEADKCAQTDLLVQLLDPTMPLSDRYVDGYFPHDMRWKVIFLLSANNETPFRSKEAEALWSRVEKMAVPDYSPEDKRNILLRHALTEMPKNLRPPKDLAESVADRISQYFSEGISLREAMDKMNREIASHIIGGPGIDLSAELSPSKKKIGFCVPT